MSLISVFMRNNLLKLIEEEFANHAPEMQNIIVQEIQEFAKEAMAWAEKKMEIQSNNEE